MRPKQIMLIAGEPSGDALAAELVVALREELMTAESRYTGDSQPLRTGLAPRFFGAGGPRMAAAGVELAVDLTESTIIGIPGVKGFLKGRELFQQLVQLAIDRQPDAIIGVDYNYFNLKFAHAIRKHIAARPGWFHGWRPKLVKYVSPQVWASRESRVYQIARDFDLLLSIFPFEKQWYSWRVPKFPVEFVGHPMIERFQHAEPVRPPAGPRVYPRIVLLPGSRVSELNHHLPVMIPALRKIQEAFPQNQTTMVLPTESLQRVAADCADFEINFQIGDIRSALAQADLAITKTGTVSMECAYFGVPAVTMYKTSWLNYEFGKRVVTVKSLTMANLIAGQEIYPEFLQRQATPEHLADAALDLLRNEHRRAWIKARLVEIIASLGGPGASHRAAHAIVRLLEKPQGI